MTNSKMASQPQSEIRDYVDMNLSDFVETVARYPKMCSLESLANAVTIWIKLKTSVDMSNTVLCIDATNAPENFNYLSLIRALVRKTTDGRNQLAIAGFVVGGVPFEDEYTNSVLQALDIISELTNTPYMNWSDKNVGKGSLPLVPTIRGYRPTGSSAILLNTLLTDLLKEDYEQEFTHKLLTDRAYPCSASSAALKLLHNKYPAVLRAQRIEVLRPNSKGVTSSYNYKLTGFRNHAQAPCCPA